MDQKNFRIIDVNLNRLRESLRLIEDLSRFVFEEEKLFKSIKNIRHKMAALLKKTSINLILLTFRQIEKDFGSRYTHVQELKREKFLDILTAEFKRAQEASRVLEEVGKMISASFSAFFKKLRFRLYHLEKKFLLKLNLPSR